MALKIANEGKKSDGKTPPRSARLPPPYKEPKPPTQRYVSKLPLPPGGVLGSEYFSRASSYSPWRYSSLASAWRGVSALGPGAEVAGGGEGRVREQAGPWTCRRGLLASSRLRGERRERGGTG